MHASFGIIKFPFIYNVIDVLHGTINISSIVNKCTAFIRQYAVRVKTGRWSVVKIGSTRKVVFKPFVCNSLAILFLHFIVDFIHTKKLLLRLIHFIKQATNILRALICVRVNRCISNIVAVNKIRNKLRMV